MARNLFTVFETQDVDDSGDDFDIPHEDLASDTSSESDSDSHKIGLVGLDRVLDLTQLIALDGFQSLEA